MDTTGYIVTFLGIAFSGVGVWGLQTYLKSQKNSKVKYDIFLSYPMKGFYGDKKRNEIEDVIELTRKKIETDFVGIRIFSSLDDSNSDGKRLLNETKSFNALSSSRCFILIYPEKISSSVLVEAGYALAQGKISIFLSPSLSYLPYLIQVNSKLDSRILLFEYSNTNDLPGFVSTIISNLSIKKNGRGDYIIKLPKMPNKRLQWT